MTSWRSWTLRNVVVSALVIAAVSAAVTVYLQQHRQVLPYSDSLRAGNSDEWKAFGGNWETRDGQIQNNSDERGAKLTTGSAEWADYSVEADVNLLGAGGDAGLLVRTSKEEEGVDAYNGYYAGLRNFDNTLTLGRADHGWMEYQAVPVKSGVRPLHWYHLKVVAYGCSIAARVSDSTTGIETSASLQEPGCPRTGRIGLRSYAAGGAWRNIKAARATIADLNEIARGTSTVISSSQMQTEAGFNAERRPLSTETMQTQALRERDDKPNQTVVPIQSLRFASRTQPTTETVRGWIVLTTPILAVEDATGGVIVDSIGSAPARVGDEVEVVGVVQPKPFSAELLSARIGLRSTGPPMPPLSITAGQAVTGAFDARYVEMEGRLTGLLQNGSDLELELVQDTQRYRAVVNGGHFASLSRRLRIGSLIRIRGVILLDSAFTHGLTPFVTLLHSENDIEVVSGPPWWDYRHRVEVGFLILLLSFAAYFVYSRIERWRLYAVFEERQRMAHDLHDTLSQSFAGIGFHLQALQYELPEDSHLLHDKIEMACQVVRRSHLEARQTIATLRSGSSGSSGLIEELEQVARNMVDSSKIMLHFSVSGSPSLLPLKTLDVVFRIGQEAIANAVRHANPTRVAVTMHYDANAVSLLIEDNGTGFIGDQEFAGFGLKGMRERASAISATLTILSELEKGTRVELILPAPRSSVLNRIKEFTRSQSYGHSNFS